MAAKNLGQGEAMQMAAIAMATVTVETIAVVGTVGLETMEAVGKQVPVIHEEEQFESGAVSERRLWTAVIIMAIEDWRSGSLRARREAQEFLFESGDDFSEVCASANLDPSSLRAKLLRLGNKINMHGPMNYSLAA